MAVLVIKDGVVVLNEAVGTTRVGGIVNVDSTSKWHLGSCSKAITAVIIATVVDEGLLTWDSRVVDVFPEYKDSIRPEYIDVTLQMLLAHRGGLQHTTSSKTDRDQLRRMEGPLSQRRLKYVIEILQDTPVVAPGSYSYSNAGFILAAAMAERVTNRLYEELALERLFRPLGMTSVGFGTQNYLGGESQPMPHYFDGKRLIPVDTGIVNDNPDVITPAGRIHMTLSDWSKFALFEMGMYDSLRILKPLTRKTMQRPSRQTWTYDWGWGFATRQWATGYVLVHSGSNTVNYMAIWLAPTSNFAIVIASNAGTARDAIDEVYGQLAPLYITKPGAAQSP